MELLLQPRSSLLQWRVRLEFDPSIEFELMYISGFNMENSLAKFVTYAAFLVDGNPVTNLMSIGGKSSLTGQDPPSPAIVGGLDTHAVFEG